MKTSMVLMCIAMVASAWGADSIIGADGAGQAPPALVVPQVWEYSAPLITPRKGKSDAPVAPKDPSVVFHQGQWHVFMTVRYAERVVTEYCAFANWEDADRAPRTVLQVSDSRYFCAPQVFYFAPHKKWYLIYQVGVPGQKKMQVAYSTTTTLGDPLSWSAARPMLDGGPGDPRTEGGIDFWGICDQQRAWLFFTSNNGKLWRMWTTREEFPQGWAHCELALQAKIFEASHTYRLQGSGKYLTIIEENGRRYYKAYLADRLDGPWTPLADTAERPFAGWTNIRPAPGVEPWTDNVSHGELVRVGVDETMTVDPANLQFVFQGMWEREKAGKKYGQFEWRIGILRPAGGRPATAREK